MGGRLALDAAWLFAAFLLLVVVLAAALAARRYLLERGGGTVECGLRNPAERGAWRLGVASYQGDELSQDDQITVQRARRTERFLSHPMYVAEQFTGQPGVFVPLEETISSFKAIAEGKYDNVPEQAFYMVGGIEDVEKKAKDMERS